MSRSRAEESKRPTAETEETKDLFNKILAITPWKSKTPSMSSKPVSGNFPCADGSSLRTCQRKVTVPYPGLTGYLRNYGLFVW